jgi:hypothetical protein
MLAILIKRARDDGQINKVVPHLVDGDLSILQYADDTILFMKNDLEKAYNIKFLLCAFKGVFGRALESNSKGEQARASQTSQLRSKMLLES